MTRRKLIVRVAQAAAAICVGLRGIPRGTVRAVRPRKYPGTIVPMGDIRTQSRWSG